MNKTKIADSALIAKDISKMSFVDQDEANYIMDCAIQCDISTIFIVEEGQTDRGDLCYVVEIEKHRNGKFTYHVFDAFKITSFNRESASFGDVEGVYLSKT